MKNNNANIKDGALILCLGALVFFGALFLFSSFNDEAEFSLSKNEINEEILDKKINSRIHAIEAKLKFKKLKRNLGNARVDSVEQSSMLGSGLDLYKIEDKKTVTNDSVLNQTIEMVNEENESEEERRAYIESYKAEYKRQAKEDGWMVELNDDLEVVSARKIKKRSN